MCRGAAAVTEHHDEEPKHAQADPPESKGELDVSLSGPFRIWMSLPKSVITAIWPSISRNVMPAVGKYIIPAIAKYFIPAVSISLIISSLFYGLSMLLGK